MLEKIDKLFACGVGEMVALPQIVVVGDQSSGKSSVLEGLINKPLPRDSGLCTRFATQIIFRRAAIDHISIAIIPDRLASEEHRIRLAAWKKTVTKLDSEEFTNIMKEVHSEMGLANGSDENKPTFSNNVLQLEISGPTQEHLTVIDVPGIFKSTTSGLTTKEDISLVRNMVKEYMDNPRSVMLAVIPANVDVATQEILEMAAEADPDGDRTLGVLTKPDLVDKGAEPRVLDLLEGRSRPMKLGWHVIRNPGQKELSDTTVVRATLEAEFFRTTVPWNSIDKGKFGVDELRSRLKEVLTSLVKREFPKVKVEIKSRLDDKRQTISNLGPERKTSADQMAYLTKIASTFQRLVSLALSANYGADAVFNTSPALRIAPAVMARMKTFADEMGEYGMLYRFLASGTGDPATSTTESDDESSENGSDPSQTGRHTRKMTGESEIITDILHASSHLGSPVSSQKIREWLHEIFRSNRGFELGTFNPSILATAMKQQASKWQDISLAYISDIIVMVQTFIEKALYSICSDRSICEAILATLSDELVHRYQAAIDNVKLFLEVDHNDMPMTLNHYFNDSLQKRAKLAAGLKQKSFESYNDGEVVKLDQALNIHAHNMSNDEHVVQDIHDILKSYYKQSTGHFLLYCSTSPLTLFSPVFVSQLTAVELEEIAGEAPSIRKRREQVSKEVESLSEAMKILARA